MPNVYHPHLSKVISSSVSVSGRRIEYLECGHSLELRKFTNKRKDLPSRVCKTCAKSALWSEPKEEACTTQK